MSVQWTGRYINQRLNLSGRRFVKTLFFGCKLDNLRGATLESCCLTNSEIAPKKMDDVAGITVTLNCFSWKDVTLNELAFDLMIWLLSLTKGNDEKRAVLKRIIRSDHMVEFQRELDESIVRDKSIDEI